MLCSTETNTGILRLHNGTEQAEAEPRRELLALAMLRNQFRPHVGTSEG